MATVTLEAKDFTDAKCKMVGIWKSLNPGDIITLQKEAVARLVEKGLAEYIEDMPGYALRARILRQGDKWKPSVSTRLATPKRAQARRRDMEAPSQVVEPELPVGDQNPEED